MKKNKIIAYILIALMISACEGDFLDKNPLDQVSSQTFWNNESEAYLGLMGVYSRLQASIYSTRRYNLDALTDNLYNMQNSDNVINISQGDLLPATGGIANSIYYDAYKGISACNIFLQNIVNVEMNEATKSSFVGEVKFIRAWFYWNLQQFYGDVVVYEEPPTVEESRIKQSPAEQVLALVHRDLDDAIAVLPNESYTGRIVKNSALALKAKVYLHEAKWAEAASTAQQVMSSGKTTLSDDYSGLFIPIGQDTNPDEILFSSRFRKPDNTHWYHIYVAWYTEPNPRKELVDAFQCTDGLPISQSPLYDENNPYANRDPRLLESVQVEPWILNGEEIVQEATITGFIIQKGIDKELGQIGYDVQYDNDIVHLRYADVLLMYAEAKNEASGPDQSVYDAVNAVRGRSSMPALETGLSKEALRDKIRFERRIELAFEGHRYLDLKRWGTIAEVLAAVDEPGQGIGGLKFESHHNNWPFPQGEMDVNDELDQKAGY